MKKGIINLIGKVEDALETAESFRKYANGDEAIYWEGYVNGLRQALRIIREAAVVMV